jgi:PTS system mannose-specific IIA component
VALGRTAALLRGPSGSGKSDLALRFLFLARRGPAALEAPILVADDQVCLVRNDGRILAKSPDTIRGKMEVRGVGIVEVKSLMEAELALVVDLMPGTEKIERLPEGNAKARLLALARTRDVHHTMIGVVIVAHGGLAAEFRAALEHVVGPQEQLEALSIGPEDDVEARRMELIETVRRVDAGGGVIVLTDMFGGTPSNLAISVMAETGAEVLAGINLPMLIKLASVRGEAALAAAVNAAKEAGRKYISVASQVLSGEP